MGIGDEYSPSPEMRIPYICGPLTELPREQQQRIKEFYERLADVCLEVFGERAFVPHEHYDPVVHAHYTPHEVDGKERYQVCYGTSCLIVVAIEPSWGGGIEVEMANSHGVPVIILCEREKLEKKKISRLLRGNPAVIAVISYDFEAEALEELRSLLKKVFDKETMKVSI